MHTTETIEDFLAKKRLAVVGVSRNPKDFTRSLFRELIHRGYDVVPVHPQAGDIEGIPAVRTVQQATPAVEGALLLTKPSVSSDVVKQCHEAGISSVWLYRATPGAADFCAGQGISLVEGECPFMYLPRPGFPHNVHKFCHDLFH